MILHPLISLHPKVPRGVVKFDPINRNIHQWLSKIISLTNIMESLILGRRHHQLQGGYECVFVSDPPKILQTECSVCLCVLREPYLVDCCGNSFCKTCIDQVKSDKRPVQCPVYHYHTGQATTTYTE